MNILVLNCGSSSIKYQLLSMPKGLVLAKGAIARIGSVACTIEQHSALGEFISEQSVNNHHQGLDLIATLLTDPEKGAISDLDQIDACGHRVVHGGEAMTGSVLIDKEVEKTIEDYAELAPLHNPQNLNGIREARKLLGDIPMVACFDTAFHQTLPQKAYLYALPYEYYTKHRIRRYGFHGASHQYVTMRAAAQLKLPLKSVNLITCHLGNGCSVTAMRAGRSVDTSMGFTPLAGVTMGTRSGSFDPAILLYLTSLGYSAAELDSVINQHSGLLGISGISNDIRDLEQQAALGNRRAQLALDIFAYSVKKYIGAYLAILNGCHAIIMTGGIGEHGAAMRKHILSDMETLGIELDPLRNQESSGQEADIATDLAQIRLLVIPTNEELMLAHETMKIVDGFASA